jgi:uncharacterized membrane protein YjgN (DUF898 family)
MWYYKTDESQKGPISKAEVQQLINDRKIGSETLVRKEGNKEWQPLKNLAPSRSDDENQSEKSIPAEPVEIAAGDSLKADSENIPFAFSGTGREYFKIWIVNILLSIVTLGIYSAWAKVRSKQYFYGSTEVDSVAFQYLADPFLILKGRLIVFVGFIIYSIINQLSPLFGMLLSLILLPALPWFIIRALSFNARNSAIRNIRFNFNSTYWEATKVFLLLPLLLPLTFGLIFPYLFYRQRKFIVKNSAYGTVSFDFKATAKDYYLLFFGLLLLIIFCISLLAAAGFLLHLSVSATPYLAVVFVVIYLYAMAYIAVKSNNLFYNSSNLSDHRFKSTMAIKGYIFILITNTIGTVITLGLFYPFAKVRAYCYQIEHLSLISAGDLNAFVAAEQKQISALGDEVADFMDFDFGL